MNRKSKILSWVAGICLATSVLGCAASYPKATVGGGATATVTSETVTTTEPDGSVITTEKSSTIVDVDSPSNPKENTPVNITLLPDGTVRLNTDLGSTYDVTSAIAAINSLRPLIFIGAFMIVGGLVIGFWLKQVRFGVILAVGGGCLITLGFLLGQYPMVFLIGTIIAGVLGLAYAVYLCRGYLIRDKATKENVKLIEEIKKDLPPDKLEKNFKKKDAVANKIQSRTTKNLVAQIKDKTNWSGLDSEQ